jgi:hypothetical protein
MRNMPELNPACYKCRGETVFKVQIHAAGSEPGQRVYECKSCGEMTWTPLAPIPRAPIRPADNQPAQQQQQIQPGDDDEPGER